ncbi:MAG: protein kinase [Aquabacterium sp.]
MPTISEHDALPSGTRLGEFEIQQVLGIGGFGVVYLAFDHALQRQVAIKEYMPAALSSRGFGAEVVVRSASHADTFSLGLRSFINEARLLARYDHPSLVKVYRFWEQNGTAYMVMPYYRGRTLQDVRRDMPCPPDEAWLRRLISPLLGALECLHRENVFHRDVAPDNILLLDDDTGQAQGAPVLLDLGAARKVIGDHTQTLTAIVKPSFAPIEQYAETVQLRQGPWTDLYAVAAVVYFCITGRPPSPATARSVDDEVVTLGEMRAGLASAFDRCYSEAFLHAIDHALRVRPQERPESIAAWRQELQGIVTERGAAGSSGHAPRPAKSDAWVAQYVLLHREGSEGDASAPGRGPDDAFMTTIPAAGRLHAPPAWPHAEVARRDQAAPFAMPATIHVGAPPAAEGPSSAALQPQRNGDIPATIPMARPASVTAPDAPADQPSDAPLRIDPAAFPATMAIQREPSTAAPRPTPAVPMPPVARSTTPGWLKGAFGALLLCLGLAIWWSQPRSKPEAIAEQPDVRLTASTALSGVPSEADRIERQPPGSGQRQASVLAERKSRGELDASARRKPVSDQARTEGPLNPRKACGDRSFIMLAICMKRHCSTPEYSGHGECERMRQQEAAQRGNYYP